MLPFAPQPAQFLGLPIPNFDLPRAQFSSAVSVLDGQVRTIASELAEIRLLMGAHPDNPHFLEAYKELLARHADVTGALKDCAVSSDRADEHYQAQHTNRTFSNNAVTTALHHDNANVSMHATYHNHQAQMTYDFNHQTTMRQREAFEHESRQTLFQNAAFTGAMIGQRHSL